MFSFVSAIPIVKAAEVIPRERNLAFVIGYLVAR